MKLTARLAQHEYAGFPSTPVWAYEGQIPGPLVEAKIRDTFVANFENELPEATTIHWHGLRLPVNMDGNPAVVPPVAPKGTFRYSFPLKDAGLYWYHPHVRADVQVQKGLYGVFLVREEDEPKSDEEKVLVLDDIRLKKDGTIQDYLDDSAKMMGSEGETLLVNGAVKPTLHVRPGATLRLRLLNAANGRFFNLRLPRHRLTVVGTDGGRVPQPEEVERVLMAPGERYDVWVKVQREAGALTLWNDPYERGHESGARPPLDLATIEVSGAAVDAPAAIPTRGPEIARLPATAPRIPIVLDEGSHKGELVFTVNGKAHPEVPVIGVPTGAVRVLDVRNVSEMDHPFHLHGFFFQVLARNGKAEPKERLANKDTLIVPAKSSVTLVARFDEPGRWMYHCHILEHAELGMMGDIEVGKRSLIPKPHSHASGHAH